MSNSIPLTGPQRAARYRIQELIRTGQYDRLGEGLPTLERIEFRAARIQRGEGGRPLTPRQRRRIWKKSKHTVTAIGRMTVPVVPVQVQVVDDTPGHSPAATRPCGGTDHCVTSSGKRASRTHVKCAEALIDAA